MKLKIIILKIIKDNQPIGINKFDRLFYDKVEFNVQWHPIMEELKKEGLIIHMEEGNKLTPAGEKFLQQHI